ncbi:MAG: hypothetical protein ABFD79_16370 [Phycisphaerales bacterium]
MQKRIKKNLLEIIYASVLIMIFAFVGYSFICWSIASSVNSISKEAMKEFGPDKVQALMAYVDCSEKKLKKRNSAVWALGQIGDKRALNVLIKYYKFKECDHDHELCQYELKKAINCCQGGFNSTAWMRKVNYFQLNERK